jgi:hypothetical protein
VLGPYIEHALVQSPKMERERISEKWCFVHKKSVGTMEKPKRIALNPFRSVVTDNAVSMIDVM